MKKIKSIIFAGLWITLSEFIRNEFLLKSFWEKHYNSIGLQFTTKAFNGILWLLWSFILAYLIAKLSQRFSFVETLLMTWVFSFLMMWLVIYNLQVLPLGILLYGIPLSILEVVVAQLIIKDKKNKGEF